MSYVPSHIQTLLSRPQVASSVPVEENETHLHSFSWPSIVLLHSHSVGTDPASPFTPSHMPIVESKLAVASNLPDGAHAMERTERRWPVSMTVVKSSVIVLSFRAY